MAFAAYAEDSIPEKELSKARAASGAEAIAAYRALATDYPRSMTVWYELGEALYEVKDWGEALKAYRTAEKLGKKSDTLHVRIGKCLQKLKRHSEAEASFRKALELKPGALAARFGLGAALFNQDKAAEALTIFEELSRREDEWGDVSREYLAETHYALGHYDAAIPLAQALLRKSPNDPAFHWLAGKSLFKRRRFQEALPHFQQVAQSDAPRAEAAHYYEAACLEGLGRKDEAESAYRKLSSGSSIWAEAARRDARTLAGPGLHFVLDYSGGYDTNVIRNNPDATPAGQQDGFNQVYLDVMGRVLRKPHVSLWLGAEHFSLHYFKLRENDYFQDAPKLLLNFPKAGPFQFVSLRYQLNFSELDGDKYRKEHRFETGVLYQNASDRISFDFYYGDNTYFGLFSGVGGPETGASADYRRKLPGHEHLLRLRVNAELRFSDAETERRNVERVRLQYRARIAPALFGQIEAQYRHTDYPHTQGITSDGAPLKRRIDNRWSAEVQFDWQINSRVFLNWGYQIERQESTREIQRYDRQQGNLGFTLQF